MPGDTEARDETAALVDDLKAQLRKAEDASDGYQRQLNVAQSRLEEALGEQTRLEETTIAQRSRIETLEQSHKAVLLQNKELESMYESDQIVLRQAMDSASSREEELSGEILRLGRIIAREPRRSSDSEGRPSQRGKP